MITKLILTIPLVFAGAGVIFLAITPVSTKSVEHRVSLDTGSDDSQPAEHDPTHL